MSTPKAVRGTRDLLPPETELWNRVEATARRVFARYNFGEIRTPIFEDTQLFARGVGEETDIVSKEMYTWEDGERFDLQALIGAWKKVQREEKHYVFENAPEIEPELRKLGVALILGRRNPEMPEFVSFGAKITQHAIDGLLNAKRALRERRIGAYSANADYLRTFGPQLRLVVPAGTPTKGVGSGEVVVEEFAGKFYQSSQSLTLRPENTAGVVRAYIEHKLGETGLLQKLFYIGPQFRRERPQKGRYRQFFQIGAEVIGPVSSGSESPLRDAEILEMLATFLDELGIVSASRGEGGYTLAINSVGSMSDRPRYIAALRQALASVAPTLCTDCQQRAHTNPLRVLDCKVPEDQPVIDTLPKIADFLDEASTAHFAAVRAALDACGVAYQVNPRLVRGLDYYTRTTFEFTHSTGLGTQNALLGGGRYDGLSEMLGGPRAPGIGFAIGADRLILTLESLTGEQPATKADAFIAPVGEAMNAPALELARELRRAGLRIELGDGAFRLKKSFETADKLARKIIIFGEDEQNSGLLTVKDFAGGEQVKVPRSELAAHLSESPGRLTQAVEATIKP